MVDHFGKMSLVYRPIVLSDLQIVDNLMMFGRVTWMNIDRRAELLDLTSVAVGFVVSIHVFKIDTEILNNNTVK